MSDNKPQIRADGGVGRSCILRARSNEYVRDEVYRIAQREFYGDDLAAADALIVEALVHRAEQKRAERIGEPLELKSKLNNLLMGIQDDSYVKRGLIAYASSPGHSPEELESLCKEAGYSVPEVMEWVAEEKFERKFSGKGSKSSLLSLMLQTLLNYAGEQGIEFSDMMELTGREGFTEWQTRKSLQDLGAFTAGGRGARWYLKEIERSR